MMPSILSRLARNRSAHCRGFGAGLDGAVPGLLGGEADRLVTGALDGGDHLLASGFREVSGEEAAVPDDDSECHG